MLTLPNPLHPAIVHFPIVLLLVGAATAVAAVAVRRVFVQALAASFLLLGTVGSFVAAETGEEDEGARQARRTVGEGGVRDPRAVGRTH